MKKLFYQNTNIIEFGGVVVSCEKQDSGSKKKSVYQVVLDQTAFFPEEGGQIADKGFLDQEPVLDVQIREDVIYHMIGSPVEVGKRVKGVVDWNQRFDFMQQHSGEHIISGLVHKYYGFQNVGFHLSNNEVTLDFDSPLTLEELRKIEQEANKIIWHDIPIHAYFPDAATLSSMNYRSKLDLLDNIRIVEIPGVDTCACCAPHVSSTAQIGLLKITNVQSHRGGVRLHILCGTRALKDYTDKQDTLWELSSLLSAKPEKITESVQRVMDENKKQKERSNQLQEQLLQKITEQLDVSHPEKNLLFFTPAFDSIAIRNSINEITKTFQGYCAFFFGSNDKDYQFIIGSSGRDCKVLLKLLQAKFTVKGGGSPNMIQGSIQASRQELESLPEFI